LQIAARALNALSSPMKYCQRIPPTATRFPRSAQQSSRFCRPDGLL
jgi:hypothetical protein